MCRGRSAHVASAAFFSSCLPWSPAFSGGGRIIHCEVTGACLASTAALWKCGRQYLHVMPQRGSQRMRSNTHLQPCSPEPMHSPHNPQTRTATNAPLAQPLICAASHFCPAAHSSAL